MVYAWLDLRLMNEINASRRITNIVFLKTSFSTSSMLTSSQERVNIRASSKMQYNSTNKVDVYLHLLIQRSISNLSAIKKSSNRTQITLSEN